MNVEDIPHCNYAAETAPEVKYWDGVLNDLGLRVVLGVTFAMLGLAALNGIWFLYRFSRIKRLGTQLEEFGRPLSFHSPDDTPRYFKQFPYRSNLIGTVLMNAWVVFFVVGYLWMMVHCWFVYPAYWGYDKTEANRNSAGLGAPYEMMDWFGGWSGLVAPWLFIYTAVHFIWFLIICAGDALRTQYMIPVKTFEDATHVVVEEDLPFDTDENLVDPDVANDVQFGQFLMMSRKASSRYKQLSGSAKRIGRRTVLPITGKKGSVRQIEYTCVNYSYDQDAGMFVPRGIREYEPVEVHQAYSTGGLSHEEAKKTLKECGSNEINVQVPSVLQALVAEFLDFTKVVASVGTWAYMVYSTANLGLVWFGITFGTGAYKALCITRPNQKENAELARLEAECEVLRGGEWIRKEAKDIVLGDIIRVDDYDEPKMPVDGILIEGTIVTNESMLTGEPMPVQKLPAEDSEYASVTKRNIAYAGTKVLQSSGPANGKAVMIATAVGALTTRGQLVRMVLFPVSVRFKYIDQLPYVYMMLFAYMLLMTVIYLNFIDVGGWVGLFLITACTCAMTLNPMLPVSMVMGQATASTRLKSNLDINCLQPSRIPIAGKISTMVFDKTGTITKEGMDFTAVVPVANSQFQQRVSFDSTDPESPENRNTVSTLQPHVRHFLASCHTVTKMRDGRLIGNAVEVSMVTTCGWDLGQDGDMFIKSPTGEKLEVLKKMDFDHHRMTSGVVVRRLDTNEIEVYVKGSYENIKKISLPQSAPGDYDAYTATCAKEGYYTLGVSMKTLPAHVTKDALTHMSRDELESGLSVCGLLLFLNEMKPDSPDAFEALEKGSIRSVICTGDNALTGISIGKKCGVVKTSVVLLGDMESGQLVWRDPDTNKAHNIENEDCQLGVTHSAWRHLHSHLDELEEIWPRIVVFARMKPEDKINVVTYLQSQKLVVGMAGDGGNDCGGLRAAHAGMALSDAEASMVSPFSSGRDGKSLMTVVDMIREGRCCLATNMATFRFFLVYGFIITYIRTYFLLYASLSMGEYCWLTNDIVFGILMVSFMVRAEPTDELCSYRPAATLFGIHTVSSIAWPVFSAIILMTIANSVLWHQDWYEKVNPLYDLHIPGHLWMLKGDNFDSPIGVFFLFLVLSTTGFVNTYGGDFRKNVLNNWGVTAVYFITVASLVIMLIGPSQFSCLFRVMCDTEQSLASGQLLPLKWFSSLGGAGLVGGCFLGPEIADWQDQIGNFSATTNLFKYDCCDTGSKYDCTIVDLPANCATGDTRPKCVASTYEFLPEDPYGCSKGFEEDDDAFERLMTSIMHRLGMPKEMEDVCTRSSSNWIPTANLQDWQDAKNCRPPAIEGLAVDPPFDEPDFGCVGANNCYSTGYKWSLGIILFLWALMYHFFVKVVLQGPIATYLRKRQERGDRARYGFCGDDDESDYTDETESDE